jgi:peptidoglycan hydrolase-like protein with peptidoglycan-binding domain
MKGRLAGVFLMRQILPTRMWCVALLCFATCLSVRADETTTSSAKSAPKKTPSSKKHSIHTTSTKASPKKGKHSAKSRTAKKRGQKAIDSERTQQIQEALIRQHYLTGSPTGKWDAATEAALRKYQGEQGWQTKTVPDSRALIKLGLGPSHEHLLNPETAMTTVGGDSTASQKRPAPDPPVQAAPTSDATPQQ